MKPLFLEELVQLKNGKRFIGIEDQGDWFVRSFLCEVDQKFIRVFMGHWEPNANHMDHLTVEEWIKRWEKEQHKFYLFDSQTELLQWLLEKAEC